MRQCDNARSGICKESQDNTVRRGEVVEEGFSDVRDSKRKKVVPWGGAKEAGAATLQQAIDSSTASQKLQLQAGVPGEGLNRNGAKAAAVKTHVKRGQAGHFLF